MVERTHHGSECLRKLCTRLVAGLGVHGVTHERVAKLREVDTRDAFARLEPTRTKTSIPLRRDLESKPLDDGPVCNGTLPPWTTA